VLAAQEAERVMDTFEKHLHLPVTKIDDAERMMSLLKARARQLAPLHAPEATRIREFCMSADLKSMESKDCAFMHQGTRAKGACRLGRA